MGGRYGVVWYGTVWVEEKGKENRSEDDAKRCFKVGEND
jgi:hypothetical protein